MVAPAAPVTVNDRLVPLTATAGAEQDVVTFPVVVPALSMKSAAPVLDA